MPFAQVAEVGGQDGGAVELTGFDSNPDLHCARISKAEWALGEVEPFGPLCGVCQLGLGGGQIAAHEADKARYMYASAIGSLGVNHTASISS